MLNCLNLNLVAVITFRFETNDKSQILIAVFIFVTMNLVPLILSRLLYKLNDELHSIQNKNKYGSIYTKRNVSNERKHRAWINPLVFFFRRTFFIFATVYQFEQPAMQMIIHYVLSTITIAYLSYDKHMFISELERAVEITAEVFLMLISALIQQLMVLSHSKETVKALEVMILAAIGLFVTCNLVHLIYTLIANRRLKKRRKALEESRAQYKEYQDAHIELEKKEYERRRRQATGLQRS